MSEDPDVLFPFIGFARDNKGQVLRSLQESQLKTKIAKALIDEDTKQLEKLKKQAENIVRDKQQEEAKQPEEEKEIFRVFVSCDRAEDADMIVEEYRGSVFTLGYAFLRREKRFAGKRIVVSRAPEPSNLLWENQDCPRFEGKVRRGIIKFLVLIILCVSAFLVVMVKAKQGAAQKSASTGGCPRKSFIVFPVDNTGPGQPWNPPTLAEMLAVAGRDGGSAGGTGNSNLPDHMLASIMMVAEDEDPGPALMIEEDPNPTNTTTNTTTISAPTNMTTVDLRALMSATNRTTLDLISATNRTTVDLDLLSDEQDEETTPTTYPVCIIGEGTSPGETESYVDNSRSHIVIEWKHTYLSLLRGGE